jgi:hypothetical protein
VNLFLAGMIAALQGIASLYFFRFYRKTNDRFFALFSLSFGIMVMNRLLLIILGDESEARTFVYAVRLVSYLVIIYAIVDKNRVRQPSQKNAA